MDDDTLAKIDELLAQSHLETLMSGEANASDRQAARQYLASKGYTGPSIPATKKHGDGDHPILKLANWSDEDQKDFG